MGNEHMDPGTFRAILEGINESIITLGIDGTIRSFNPSGESMFGLTPDHIGMKFFDTLTKVSNTILIYRK